MKKILFLLAFCLLGCATKEDLSRLEFRVYNLEAQVQQLRENQENTSLQLKKLDEKINRLSSYSEGELNTLKETLSSLKADQQEKADALQKLVLKLGTIERNLSELEKSLKELKEAKASPPPFPRTEQPPLSTDPAELYRLALESFRQEDFQRAQQLFSQFLSQFPNHELAPNAQFWIGECFYKQGDYERAILEYEKLLNRYPKSTKVPCCAFKTGAFFSRFRREKDWRVPFTKVDKRISYLSRSGVGPSKTAFRSKTLIPIQSP
jgi:tol-pal system protein YbgF